LGNIVGGLAMIGLCLVFWLQRDYSSDNGGIFPDAIMISLTVLSLALVARGVFWRRETGWNATEHLSAAGLARAFLLLVAWVASLPLLGYVVGGVIFFTLMALLMRTARLTVKKVAMDLGVALVVVGGFYVIFTRVLLVNLPEFSI
jgi:hypothetical protein